MAILKQTMIFMYVNVYDVYTFCPGDYSSMYFPNFWCELFLDINN